MLIIVIPFILFLLFCTINIVIVLKGLITYKRRPSIRCILVHLKYIEAVLWVIILMLGIKLFV